MTKTIHTQQKRIGVDQAVNRLGQHRGVTYEKIAAALSLLSEMIELSIWTEASVSIPNL